MRAPLVALVCCCACDTIYYGDGPPSQRLAESCLASHQQSPSAPDGIYVIQPDGQAARQAYCDMTADGGGWTLMTGAELTRSTNHQVDVHTAGDEHGGIAITVVPLIEGCGPGLDNVQHEAIFDAGFAWTLLRARYTFGGSVDCWSLFGDRPYSDLLSPNVLPFDPEVDAIRDELRMGGSAGDAYTGGGGATTYNTRCDNTDANFWDRLNGLTPRSAVVTLRRDASTQPAGVSTGADCVELNPATQWTYDAIYVR